ncbi:MAG: alginate export family protein [Myxococcota bacterium]
MPQLKKRILFVFIVLCIPLFLSAQDAPKKPVKITEETVNQICNDAITKFFSEERPKLIEENKKIIEEAIKAAQEENKKTLEELERHILETADKNTEAKAKTISEETVRSKIEEYEKRQREAERLKAIGGPGFIYDDDTVFRFYFDTLIRGEAYYNQTDYNSSTDDSEMRILQRSIFGGSVSYKDKLSARYKLRHTQVWGDQNLNIFTRVKDSSVNIPSDSVINSIYKGNYGIGTYEASIEIGNFRGIPLSLEAGLLRLNYGDGRFLGNSFKWFIEAEPSTAAVLKYNFLGHQIHLIYSKIRESEVLTINGKMYKTPGDDLIGAYYTYKISDDIILDGYGFYNRVGPNLNSTSGEDINVGTLGVRTDSIFGKLKLNAELIFQFGKNRERDHIAGAADINLRYHLPLNMSPYVWAGFAYATGDSGSKDTSLQFLQFYGNNECRYGILNQTALSNIILPMAGAGFYPLSRLNIVLNYYYFILASSKGMVYDARYNLSLYDPKGENGRNFGWETDLLIKFHYNKYLTLSAGYAIEQPLDYQINQASYIYKDVKGNQIVFGNDFVHYGFGMVNLNF